MAYLQRTPTSAKEIAYGSGNQRGLVGYSTDTGSASQNAANRQANNSLTNRASSVGKETAAGRSPTDQLGNELAQLLVDNNGYLMGKKAYQSYLNKLINDTVNAGGRFQNGKLTDQYGNDVSTDWDYSVKNYNNTFGINDLADTNYGDYGTYSTANRGERATNEDVQNSQAFGLAEQNAQQQAEANKVAGINAGVENAAASNVANNTSDTAANTYANSLGAMTTQNASTQADYLNKMGQVQSAQQKAQNLQNSAAYNTLGGALQGASQGASIGAGISDERMKGIGKNFYGKYYNTSDEICKRAVEEDLNGTGFEVGDAEYDNYAEQIHNLYTGKKFDTTDNDLRRRSLMLNSNTPKQLPSRQVISPQIQQRQINEQAYKQAQQTASEALKNFNNISDEAMKDREPTDNDIIIAVSKFFDLYKQLKDLKGDK